MGFVLVLMIPSPCLMLHASLLVEPARGCLFAALLPSCPALVHVFILAREHSGAL